MFSFSYNNSAPFIINFFVNNRNITWQRSDMETRPYKFRDTSIIYFTLKFTVFQYNFCKYFCLSLPKRRHKAANFIYGDIRVRNNTIATQSEPLFYIFIMLFCHIHYFVTVTVTATGGNPATLIVITAIPAFNGMITPSMPTVHTA